MLSGSCIRPNEKPPKRFAKTCQLSLIPSSRDGTTPPSQGLADDGGNEIIVFVGDQTKARFSRTRSPTKTIISFVSCGSYFFLKPLLPLAQAQKEQTVKSVGLFPGLFPPTRFGLVVRLEQLRLLTFEVRQVLFSNPDLLFFELFR